MGCRMNRCRKCGIGVRQGSVCPLCGQVLEIESGEEKPARNVYPDVRKKTKLLSLIVRAFAFFAVVLEVSLIFINYYRSPQVWWSLISGGAMIYLYITLKYSVQNNTGYIMKIIIQTIGAILLSVWIDLVVGYHGWSVDYVMPSAILLVDVVILILMFVNSMNWQSYILFQMFMVLTSVVSIGLYLGGLVRHPLLTFLAGGFSLLIFVGTLIFGDRRAKAELQRRFHI